jgi:dynein regulatory complex protein 1
MKDNLNNLKQKSSKLDKTHEQEEQVLQEELCRMKKLYEELQRKYRHFQVADEIKYQDLKKLQEISIREIVHKLFMVK